MSIGQTGRKACVRGFTLMIRVLLGCTFLWSALPKLRRPYDFLSNVYNYELLGPKLGVLVAMVLPWLELLTGICLLGGVFVSGALLVSAGMAAMLTFVLASALCQGLDISCGCFGTAATEEISYVTLIRAIAILFVSAVAYLALVLAKSQADQEAGVPIEDDP